MNEVDFFGESCAYIVEIFSLTVQLCYVVLPYHSACGNRRGAKHGIAKAYGCICRCSHRFLGYGQSTARSISCLIVLVNDNNGNGGFDKQLLVSFVRGDKSCLNSSFKECADNNTVDYGEVAVYQTCGIKYPKGNGNDGNNERYFLHALCSGKS